MQHTIQALEDWLNVHRKLIDEEQAFTDLALKAAIGGASQEEVDAARSHLMMMRDLCTVAYERAFPRASN